MLRGSKRIDMKKLGLKDIDFSKLESDPGEFKLISVEELFDDLEKKTEWTDYIPTFIRRVKHKLVDIRFQFRNLKRNLPKYWYFLRHDAPWDFECFYPALLEKLKQLENTFEFHAHVMDAPIMLKQVRIARILTQRIIADEYFEIFQDMNTFPTLSSSKKYEMAGHAYRQDREYLWNIIKKHSNCWWD